MVAEKRLREVARKLYLEVYEASFRGKDRGRFALTREQLKNSIPVKRLHASTIERLQDVSIEEGIVIIDLDDIFPCIEVDVVRRYRRPPGEVFRRIFPPQVNREGDGLEEDDEA